MSVDSKAWMRSGWLRSNLRMRAANWIRRSSRKTCADGMPDSRLRAVVGVVRQVGKAARIPALAAWSKALVCFPVKFRTKPPHASLVMPGHQISAAYVILGRNIVQMAVVRVGILGRYLYQTLSVVVITIGG